MNNDLGKALLFILLLNVIMFMVQAGITSTGSDVNKFNYGTSMMRDYDGGNYSLVEDVSTDIPEGTNTIDANTDNFFTDTWKTLRSWILAVPGANYIYNIVNAVPHFLTAIGFDREVVFAIGFLWHLLTVFLIVGWLKGG